MSVEFWLSIGLMGGILVAQVLHDWGKPGVWDALREIEEKDVG